MINHNVNKNKLNFNRYSSYKHSVKCIFATILFKI